MRQGVTGYVAKDASVNEIITGVRSVIEGIQYVSKDLNRGLLEQIFDEEPNSIHLTPKEKEVLQKFCYGSIPKEIAEQMNISIHTVNQYSKILKKKFKVNRTTDMVLYAIQKGICEPGLRGTVRG